MRKHFTLNVELTLQGPLLTRGGEMSEPGIDAPLARDRFGRYMLPFSLIKGKVVDAIRELRESDFQFDADWNRYFPKDSQLADWLGLVSTKGSYDPERGRIRFGDFHTDETGSARDNVVERIQLEQDSGAAAGRMLQMIEAPFGYGEEVTFRGKAEFIADDNEAKIIASTIDQALRWVPSYGAYRTIGFGRTQSVKTELQSTGPRSSGNPRVGDILPFRIKLDRPLCIVGRKHSRNHFESLEVISGAVLKGAVARLILDATGSSDQYVREPTSGRFPHLCKHFERVHFTEARPMLANANARPVEAPLSIVTCPTETNKGKFFDAALEEGPALIDEAAPAFLPDWKTADFALVRGAFGWRQLPRERRTRTAINPLTARAADEQLFSYGLVLPEKCGENGLFVWEGRIGLESVPQIDRATLVNELRDLLEHGIVGIGKTRAVGEVEWLPMPTRDAVGTAALPDDLTAITLQTECLMTNPQTLQAHRIGALTEAYAEFWEEISSGSLSVVRFFARQSLYGGFLSRRTNAQHYEPFLLTDRGSVFILRISNLATATSCLNQWVTQGLPTANWVQNRYARNGEPLWRSCPFLPHVGYGEIAVDLECHTRNRFPRSQTKGS
ncbi:MAG: RAMP superfamily CRISPR-associated protein [Candidatus Paceibacterota bacterium]